MFFEQIDLFPDAENTYLKALICDKMPMAFNNNRKAVLVLPGGGYHMFCEGREGDAVARAFLAAGFNAFILRYSVAPYASDFRPLRQVAYAIKYIRENAERFSIDPDKVFVIGFSAGGHLAASSGVLWNSDVLSDIVGDSPADIVRPNGMMLSYPVITSGEFAHRGSFLNLCGKEDATEEEMAVYSLEKFVDASTPPTFIWHTFTDNCVPLENSLLFADALRKNSVPFELHVYPEGWHGMSLATPEVLGGEEGKYFEHLGTWFSLAVQWTDTVK
ncbi:MAG: alpha/beta hydrolase, partial [Clostridia bacterium]|nr:alpha/beta hydrolase [Clostridia bacterium]